MRLNARDSILKICLVFLTMHLFSHAAFAASRQLVLVVAPNNDSFNGTLYLFSLEKGEQWQPEKSPWPVLLGKKGMAWGLGIFPPQEGLQKSESDDKSPEGRFKIGEALGEAPTLPKGSHGWPYHQVTARDAWIDDPTLPEYNHLVTIPEGVEFPAWFEREKMKPSDFAYHWCLLIEHNYPDAIPGKGSAIFFHIRRGEEVPSAGCVTMARPNIEKLLRWLDPHAEPQVVILSHEDYLRLWKEWNLPSPGLLTP